MNKIDTIIHNINQSSDEEVALKEFKQFVENTMEEMFNAEETLGCNMSYEPFIVNVELNGHKFILGPCAKEYNGLNDYIDYMISEI